MGYKELIDTLKKEGEKESQEIRRSAEKECERLRDAEELQMRELEEKAEAAIKKAQEAERVKIISGAAEQAKKNILHAEAETLKRAHSLVRKELKKLREADYPEIFTALARELGISVCDTVRVNSLDIKLAENHFPDALIESDDSISGGLAIFAEDRRIHLINTFEARFDRAWEYLRVEAIKNIRDTYGV